ELGKAVAAAGKPEGPGPTAPSFLANTLHIARLKQVQSAVGAAAATVQYAPGERDPFRPSRPGSERALQAEQAAQAVFLDDVFGHFPVTYPQWVWEPVAFDPAYRTPTVINLARAGYNERNLPSGELDNARLLTLADALEDAGCTGDDI